MRRNINDVFHEYLCNLTFNDCPKCFNGMSLVSGQMRTVQECKFCNGTGRLDWVKKILLGVGDYGEFGREKESRKTIKKNC